MRRKSTIFAVVAMILVAIAACSKDELGVEVIVPQQEQMDSYRVSVDEALRSAETILRAGDRDTRSAARRVKSTELYVAKPATRSNENTEVSFYLINYEDNAGYALVSTDERTTPVYMYAEDGNITTEDLQKDGPLKILMDEGIANYEAEITNYDEPVDIYFPPGIDGHMGFVDGILCYIDIDSVYVNKGPYCPVKWFQDEPYNHYCNLNKVGCGPLAMGQIMSFHKHPASYNGYTFDWDSMTENQSFSSIYIDGALDVARLLSEIGQAFPDIQYGVSLTTTSTESTKNVFAEFGYSCGDLEIYSASRIFEEIDENRPVWIRGDNNSSVGHAWIIDGYIIRSKTIEYRYTTPPYELFRRDVEYNEKYFAHNFGDVNFSQIYYLVGDTSLPCNYNKYIFGGIHPIIE